MVKRKPSLRKPKIAKNEKGLPTHAQKLIPNTYLGGIKDWQIIDTYNGKKLSFDIFFTVYGTEKIHLSKMFDFQNSIIAGTPLYSFLNDLGIIGEHREILWDTLTDMPVKVEIKISKKGTPYINTVTIVEEDGQEDDDDEYEADYTEDEYAEE